MGFRGDKGAVKNFLLISFTFYILIFSLGAINADSSCEGQLNGTYCGVCFQSGCSLVPDGRSDTLDYLIFGGTKTCQNGSCSSSTCAYLSVCADRDIEDKAPEIEGVSVSGCAAACDQDSDCTEFSYNSSTRTCSYSGGCNPGSCVCDYDESEICENDGWYCNDAGNSEYRTYSCTANGCVFDVINTSTCNDWAWCNGEETCSAGLCQNGIAPEVNDNIACTIDSCDEEEDKIIHTPDNSFCQDELYCNGVEYCNINSGCELGIAIDCSGKNINPFSMCNHDPDNNPFTLDVFTGFNSICDESTDSCSVYHEWNDLTHTCNVSSCSAECDSTHSCENKCKDNTEYTSGTCNLTSTCLCSYTSKSCDDYDCINTLYTCEGAGTNTLQEKGDDYGCSGNGCGVIGTKTCAGPWICEGNSCAIQSCGGTNYICYNGIWQESLTEICNDDIDNDCDGDIDCADSDCTDSTPPETIKIYNGLQLPEEQGIYPKYITSTTEIILNANDVQGRDECVSGLNKTYYRITLLDNNDAPCLDNSVCQGISGTGEFSVYNPIVNAKEDSCHLIEYYSVDNKGNLESVKKQCVFVDNQAPKPIKIVEEVKTQWKPNESPNDYEISYFYPEQTSHCWDGTEDAIECWKVTLETPIKMTCDEESQPHPVEFKELCYKVGWDGNDVTQSYCQDTVKEGYCCVNQKIVELTFKEECEHNLEYYCEDKLGNRESDDEKFKVIGKMEDISLDKKWNLISFPFEPINSNPEAVFNEVSDKIDSVWSYDAELNKWFVYRPGENGTNDLEEIKAGLGYWVMADEATEFNVGGSLLNPGPTSMPSQKITKGWNLIGYYGAEPKENLVYCSLFSLVDTQQGFQRWSSLWGYNSNEQSFIPLSPSNNMKSEKGYWLEIDVDDYYVPSTQCVIPPWMNNIIG